MTEGSNENATSSKDEKRKELQSLLNESKLYNAESVLSQIQGTALLAETAIVYGKVKKYIYVCNLFQEGENYFFFITCEAKGKNKKFFCYSWGCTIKPYLY